MTRYNVRKFTALFAAIAVTASFAAGCGSAPAETTVSETAAAETTAAETTAAETTTAVSEHSTVEFPDIEIADDAVTFAKNLRFGWNLGNTLDATGKKGMASETSWGQPKTTKEIIDFVKESGFTSIRIPVSWGNHVDEDFNIDEEWMARVTEVVDYAVEDGMYVIINSHHDCEQSLYYPTEEKLESSTKYLETIWTQIAENFKDYDERLVFEGMNEPRLKDTSKEWWFNDNDPEGVAAIETVTKFNQVFVDTVRKGEGYNKTRYLMVTSICASPNFAINNAFSMPTDSTENRLLLSIHAYTPYDFAMNPDGYSVWDGSHANDITWFIDGVDKKFIKNGYGVVIGEFGSINKTNTEDRVKWADFYTKTAAEHGIPCIIWDNGAKTVGNESFGMVVRTEKSILYPEVLEAMLNNYKY